MFIDLLSKESYIMVNKKLIRTIGLTNAAYMAAILDIMPAVLKKKTVDEQGYWPIDRAYVESCTGLKEDEQKLCDEALSKLEVLYVDSKDKNRIAIDLQKLLPVIVDETKCTLQSISKATKIDKETKSRNKKEAQIAMMSRHCDDLEPDEGLRELYHAWVKSVYAKNYLTYDVIDLFVDEINKFTTDINMKAEILKVAISTGYKAASWVLGSYQRNRASRGNLGAQQVVAMGMDTTEAF